MFDYCPISIFQFNFLCSSGGTVVKFRGHPLVRAAVLLPSVFHFVQYGAQYYFAPSSIMCSCENKNRKTYNETMCLCTIRGWAQRGYGCIISISYTMVVSKATIIHKSPCVQTRNCGSDGYLILKTMLC